MADHFDRDLGDLGDLGGLGEILRSEAAQWTPAVPLEDTRRLLPERIARRRQRQTVAGVCVMAAVVLVVSVAAAVPDRDRRSDIQVAGSTASTEPPNPGRGVQIRPGGGDGCAAAAIACQPPASAGAAGPVKGGPTPSQPKTSRYVGTEPTSPTVPVSRTSPPVTAPPVTDPPTSVVVTTLPPPPTTTPTTVPPPATVYTFTEADNGRTVQVNPQDRIIVSLHQCPGSEWTVPQTSDPTVLARLSGSVDPTAGTATAMFAALGTGQAQITAHVQRTPCVTVPLIPFVLTVQVS